MPADHDQIWIRVQERLRAAVSDSSFELWLAPLRPERLEGDVLVLRAPAQIRGWVADRFAGVLERAVTEVLGARARVEIAGATPEAGRGGEAVERETATSAGARDELNPKFTFEQFIVGDGNRFAHAAALAVAELPAQAYNPLFLVGPPGVGKTHLLHSIGNYVRAFGDGMVVRCATAEAFTNAFLAALHGGNVEHFKARFRGVDVLLIDDVQFLQSKARTVEEFFHTFNALHDVGSQLVLTSDRLPRDLKDLEDRLRERFESGLVADIGPPDLATRMTVLRKRVHHDGVRIAGEGVLEAIARRVTSNVRALEGALIRVVAYHSLTGRPIDAELADQVLSGLYPEGPGGGGAARRQSAPTMEAIQEATCELFGLTREELLSDGRTARLTGPRQIAMYLAREHTGASLPAIGAAFGGRNHTTVLNAWRRTAGRIGDDPEAEEAVRTLTERILADRLD